jgi:hypothetical protein
MSAYTTLKLTNALRENGGDGSGLVYLTGDVVGVIMPIRSGALELDDCAWAREALPVTAA